MKGKNSSSAVGAMNVTVGERYRGNTVLFLLKAHGCHGNQVHPVTGQVLQIVKVSRSGKDSLREGERIEVALRAGDWRTLEGGKSGAAAGQARIIGAEGDVGGRE